MAAPRIALIHATPLAIEPIAVAFAALWPEAVLANLLDDSLAMDRAAPGGAGRDFGSRFCELTRYAVDNGADAVVFTCSAFGAAIEQAACSTAVPVLKPNEAMIEETLAAGRDIVLMATFAPSVASVREDIERASTPQGFQHRIIDVHVPDAQALLLAGNAARHDALIAEAARTHAGKGLVMLSQFSMARAADAVARATGEAPLTSPASAVRRVRSLLDARAG